MKEQGTDFLAADLILSYRFDGSSGQSNYKQGYSSEQPFTADSLEYFRYYSNAIDTY